MTNRNVDDAIEAKAETVENPYDAKEKELKSSIDKVNDKIREANSNLYNMNSRFTARIDRVSLDLDHLEKSYRSDMRSLCRSMGNIENDMFALQRTVRYSIGAMAIMFVLLIASIVL